MVDSVVDSVVDSIGSLFPAITPIPFHGMECRLDHSLWTDLNYLVS